ncbi:hypothetical protein ECC34666_3976 [Escherichia coli C-34666]|nr:hypothetical protein ECMP0215527_3943 [Escherichia coli MP021552.7]EMU58766.1 hypothetical protein ECMP02155211_3711 [Escherichia coli MP021552.11]EMU67442.1 hypothetical protein ECMP02155212_3977 [Escherichia coli MP021552.12]EMV17004.1 hypothetical protein ECC34666_3976 [Escherichia coli C-34666]EMX35513.1 hypothetical protein ECMP0215528_3930 [Escherichia coli MP021552.8]ENG89009.1 hypothetical protein EC178850_3601 [Escherichia coli 178850]
MHHRLATRVFRALPGLDLLIVTANRAPVGNCTTEDVTGDAANLLI